MSYVFSKALTETSEEKERRKSVPPKWTVPHVPHHRMPPPVAAKPKSGGNHDGSGQSHASNNVEPIQRKKSLPVRSASVDEEFGTGPKMGGAFARLQASVQSGEEHKGGLYTSAYEAYRIKRSLKEHGVLPADLRGNQQLRKYSLDKELPPVVLPKPRRPSAEGKRDAFARNRSLTTPTSPKADFFADERKKSDDVFSEAAPIPEQVSTVDTPVPSNATTPVPSDKAASPVVSENTAGAASSTTMAEGSHSSANAAANEPVKDSVATKPTKDAVATEPINDSVAAEPTKDAVATEPINDTVAAELTKDNVAIEPTIDAVATEPTKDTVAIEPIIDAVVTEPTEPTNDTVSSEPTKDGVASLPSQDTDEGVPITTQSDVPEKLELEMPVLRDPAIIPSFPDLEEIKNSEQTSDVMEMKQEIAKERSKIKEGKRHLSDTIDELESMNFDFSADNKEVGNEAVFQESKEEEKKDVTTIESEVILESKEKGAENDVESNSDDKNEDKKSSELELSAEANVAHGQPEENKALKSDASLKDDSQTISENNVETCSSELTVEKESSDIPECKTTVDAPEVTSTPSSIPTPIKTDDNDDSSKLQEDKTDLLASPEKQVDLALEPVRDGTISEEPSKSENDQIQKNEPVQEKDATLYPSSKDDVNAGPDKASFESGTINETLPNGGDVPTDEKQIAQSQTLTTESSNVMEQIESNDNVVAVAQNTEETIKEEPNKPVQTDLNDNKGTVEIKESTPEPTVTKEETVSEKTCTSIDPNDKASEPLDTACIATDKQEEVNNNAIPSFDTAL
ncbi:neurobeachin-like [Hydractinia symbiolongicarpus]|uniref:neurobeachin-like n=1 Tax=Hydractinia symbiolongicarpus TaxID=13093 RepID=UPI00254C1A82|nr:neurobeachin-like [Hydractinia symbiolongicarpus]